MEENKEKKTNLLCANKNFDNNINFKIIYGDIFDEPSDVIVLSIDNIKGFKNPFLQRIDSKRRQLLNKISKLTDNKTFVNYRDYKLGFVEYKTGTIHHQQKFVICNFPKNIEEQNIEIAKILIEKMLKSILDNEEYYSLNILPINNFEFSFRLEQVAEIIIEYISQYEFPRDFKKKYKKQLGRSKEKKQDFLGEESEEDSFDGGSNDSEQMISGDDSSFWESDLALMDVILKQIRIVCPFKAQVGLN